MADAVKRPYDARRRQEQAEALRRHVIEVATPLFIAHGYGPTSVRDLADAAGVAPQTIYNAFGSKFGLFSAVMDVVIAGDHEPVALADRPEVTGLADVTDPEAYVVGVVAASVPVLERLSVIYPTLRDAIGVDPRVAAAFQAFGVDARHAHFQALAEQLAARGGLAPGVGADRAADALWAVLSPHQFHVLVVERGWPVEDFAAWAGAALVATLVRVDRT